MSLRVFKSDEPNTYHDLTISTRHRTRVFSTDETCQMLANAIGEVRSAQPFKLCGYVFLPDRVHMIVNPLWPEIRAIVAMLRMRSEKLTVRQLFETGQYKILRSLEDGHVPVGHSLWAKKHSDPPLIGEEFVRQKLDFLHRYPVRKSLCEDPVEWKWSSYNHFLKGIDSTVPLPVDDPIYWTDKEIEHSLIHEPGTIVSEESRWY